MNSSIGSPRPSGGARRIVPGRPLRIMVAAWEAAVSRICFGSSGCSARSSSSAPVSTATVGGGALSEAVGRELRSEEHTSELQSRGHLVCRLLLEQKKTYRTFD